MKDFKKNLTIKSLSKKFGNKTVLDNFNLTIAKGEFVTFLGPSGCGKSTALNCIAGLIPISEGEIYIDDECIDNSVKTIPAEKREFGMVFQSYALFPHLNVFNNVAFGLRLKKMAKEVIRDKVSNVLKMVHLDGYEDKFPGQMSGGEQQRVAIARCIVMEPRLLMLDEPLSNLDAKLRIDMRYEIKSLHARLRMTSLYVTHDQQEALALSDRIVVMRKGVIQQIGTPVEIYSKPTNLFVAGFMGFKNIWPAAITAIRESGSSTEYSIDIDGIKLLSKITSSGSPADEEQKKALNTSFRNKEKIYTAIRPEDIQIGKSSSNGIEAQVSIIEYLGQLSQISALHQNDTRIELRAEANVKCDDKISLFVDPDRILLFQKELG